MFFRRCTKSKNRYIVLDSEPIGRVIAFLLGESPNFWDKSWNAATLLGWLSEITARTWKPTSWRLLMLSSIFNEIHFLSIFVSGTALITSGTFFFTPTIINVIMPLYRFPSVSLPYIFPSWCCMPFWRNISSTRSTTSLLILSLSSKTFPALSGSIPPLLSLVNKLNDGKKNALLRVYKQAKKCISTAAKIAKVEKSILVHFLAFCI